MQREGDKLLDLICDLRQVCTPKNYRQVHMQILSAVHVERQARLQRLFVIGRQAHLQMK